MVVARPCVAGRGVVAEEYGRRQVRFGVLVVAADRQRGGKRHPDIVGRRAHLRKALHRLAVADDAPERFAMVAVGETAVARKEHRPARERRMMMLHVRDNRHVEFDFDDIAEPPFMRQGEALAFHSDIL